MKHFIMTLNEKPPIDDKYLSCSVDIDVITEDGEIIENCFYASSVDAYYNEHGDAIKNVKGWRLRHEENVRISHD